MNVETGAYRTPCDYACVPRGYIARAGNKINSLLDPRAHFRSSCFLLGLDICEAGCFVLGVVVLIG